MDKPYNKAVPIALLLLSLPFVKKLTVKGNIGKIQGIKSAANPPIKPAIKIAHKELLANDSSSSKGASLTDSPSMSMLSEEVNSTSSKDKSSGSSSPEENSTSSKDISSTSSVVSC